MNPVTAISFLVAGVFFLVAFPPLGVFLLVMAALVMTKAKANARKLGEHLYAEAAAKQRRERILAFRSLP